MKPPKITLLTCTHNGERTIEQALEAIANQTDVSRDLFEVLVIDNASSDRTSEIAKTAIQRLNLNGRVLLESCIGKINAFLKGVQEAQGELISIIDDDNLIEPGFIRYTLEIFEHYPNVGMSGSKNQIIVNQPLPSWFVWVSGRYGCAQPFLENSEQDPDGRVIAKNGIIAGAGSTFRVRPLLNCLEKGYSFFNDTQRGKKMKVTGEDTELCWLIRSLGYRFAHDPRIQIRHVIKADRLELQHFEVLSKTIGAGSIGVDPFMFTHKHKGRQLPIQWTWQWQLLSKLKRYFSLIILQSFSNIDEEQKFKNWRDKLECMGAIQRILYERNKYTKHIRQVASGEWTEFRVQ
ncbi:glycosyltransferase family 2 protein [Oculatella sp. LEGE 06141]|uniref:glycosyltransferase family A protein n=1 Tax=Oculatella sp. LEGE 06141 TaxID=1828648 RepID=UPI001882C141|nr:glycosyltransferase family A protein [Oculatella sp. LEGE 06141]MBE9179518.1 glycosyltransferase family 2 protein [Oculatella sp. LEGE 06141]